MDQFIPVAFIDEPIQVQFDQDFVFEKKPPCPLRFFWRDRWHTVEELLAEWRDYARRGRMVRNMSPPHAVSASRRGSWGVGRFYFRIRTAEGQIFDLVYDRAPKDASDRKGLWYIFRQLAKPASPGSDTQG